MPDDDDQTQNTSGDQTSGDASTDNGTSSSSSSTGDSGTGSSSQDQSGDPPADQLSSSDPVLTLTENTTAAVPPPDGASDNIAGGVEDVVNVGKAVWDVMKDNAPVTNQATDIASAIPKGADFTQLDGWASDQRRLTFHYHTENILGGNTTDLDITCLWNYNGHYQGNGQYISGATVVVSGDTAWGSHIDIKANVDSPTNSNGVASLSVRITIHDHNFLQDRTQAMAGSIQGNGAGNLSPL